MRGVVGLVQCVHRRFSHRSDNVRHLLVELFLGLVHVQDISVCLILIEDQEPASQSQADSPAE